MARATEQAGNGPKKSDSEQRTPGTIWKLVEAHCAQLSDAVSGARIPFFLALTWAFIWAWALYSVDHGYMNFLQARARQAHFWMLSDNKEEQAKFDRACNQALEKSKASAAKKRAICVELARENLKRIDTAKFDATLVTFPGGFGKLHVSDLGLLGQFGLFLILSWCYFAARRENHAVRAIVDLDDHTRKVNRLFPIRYVLESKSRYFSSEHVAYAYHSVAQRFVFLFSHHSRPLFAYTVILSTVPALVATWNTYTDVRDVVDVIQRYPEFPQYSSLLFRTFGALTFAVILWFITYRIIRFEIDTSVLLNGWSLAANNVWMEKWNEATQDPAPAVFIDAQTQRARELNDEELIALTKPPSSGSPTRRRPAARNGRRREWS